MIGEDYNEQEEERNRSRGQKVNGETERPTKKSKRNKSKTCTHCKELKLKIQELEQLNTKLMQTNKSLKESNKDANQKLNEALKENENLVKENEKLQKLLQELDHENNLKKINKKILIKKIGSKSESSEAEEEIEKDEENEMGEEGDESASQNDNNNSKRINHNLLNKNLLTDETIVDILERLSELEKFKKYMEVNNKITDSKISYLESKISNSPRKSTEEVGVPTTINKINKMIPPIISQSVNRMNEYNKSLNDDIILSKSVMGGNDYDYEKSSKKMQDKNSFNNQFLSENYIKSEPRIKSNAYKFNSKILNDREDLDLIALGLVLGDLEKLKTLKVGYKLIYRASNHGDNVKIFHKRCDNIKGTLTVIKTRDGFVFGGYCSTCWESGDELIKEDLNSFVFSINLSKIYFVSKNNEPSILCDRNKGPSFIGMFTVNDNMLNMKSDINPWGTQRYSGESSLYEINGGEPNFIIEEIEVFQVLFR
jgi:hypothetical protein